MISHTKQKAPGACNTEGLDFEITRQADFLTGISISKDISKRISKFTAISTTALTPPDPFIAESPVHPFSPDPHQKGDPDAYVFHPDSFPSETTNGFDLWSAPTPLPSALPEVQPFDPELLPHNLSPWIQDIAHRMQCPADFPAVAALVGLSSLIGARAVVQPKAQDDWQVVPNLWGAVVGRPGVKKSPALSEALKPLHRLQTAEYDQWSGTHASWTLDNKVAQMQADFNEKKAKGLVDKNPAAARALLDPNTNTDSSGSSAEPVARRFLVNDATVEKLGELLQHNPWGTLSYRDELYGLLTSLDKPGQEGSRAFYLQSYDGNQSYTFDRIGRGTIYIPRICLSLLGGIQPGRIQEYVRGAVAGGSADDGLLQRFGLAVWPDITGEFIHVDQWPDTPAKQTAWAVFDRLAQLEAANETDPVIWRFDAAAQASFVEWLVPFETELRTEELHPAMVSHLAKYRKLIPALALLFALIDTPENNGIIHQKELLRALAWSDYLRSHAQRLYAAALVPETRDAAALLAKIKAGKLVDHNHDRDRDTGQLSSFTPRQVAQKGWTGLSTPEAVRKAAELLCEYGWLMRETQLSSDVFGRGRPSERYLIHPTVLAGRSV
jgi:putative DNA primase/helicase